MKRLIFGLLVSVCAVSCQVTLGGGQITLSGNDFQVDKEGGEVSITTSCVGHCDISEKENPPYEIHTEDFVFNRLAESVILL